ncbi:BatD family protein [Flavobacterium sp.]|jgi:hypothetical protein|uniref:BatD family protein n=1 Tax=Flavobacterium sp. TaxID=239 RepID=UPI002A82051C|nr:BatD family protein [Flavobacterium sp.]
MKKILALLFFPLMCLAQEVKFEAATQKDSYSLNERFVISFTINNEADNFVPPNFSDFNVQGPMMNKGGASSIEFVNGRLITKRILQTQFVYYLVAKKKGKFFINPAEFEFEDKIYKSNPLTINITDAVEVPKDTNDPSYLAENGVHLIAEVSNSNPYLNEPLTVVYKILVNPAFGVANMREVKTPKYNGFWNQELELQQLQPQTVNYQGKEYKMLILKKVVLYPLEKGTQLIEPLSLSMDIEMQMRKRFGPLSRIVIESVPKTVTAGSKTINVKPLPENGKPADFTGAVGNFLFKVKPSKTKLKTGESFDLEIAVSGNGNLKLFDLPKTEFPSAFEVFDPQHKEEVKTPLSGMNGKISDTYTIVPQFKGKYTIQPIQFSYFDLGSKTYKTITSEEITIDVLDNPNFTATSSPIASNKKEVIKNNVFQFIKLNSNFESVTKKDFLGSNLFYTLLFAPLLLIPIVILAKKKKEAIDADVFGNRVKRNNRLAKKFLSDAKKQMGNKVPFYMAMEKALHNFLKAKLYIETSEMSKENIQEMLREKQANENDVEQFMQLMNDCEFARYTPSSDVAMQKDYDKAVEIISELSKQL